MSAYSIVEALLVTLSEKAARGAAKAGNYNFSHFIKARRAAVKWLATQQPPPPDGLQYFTVVGYYEDNHQSFSSTVAARNALEAFARIADDAPTFGGDLMLVCAVDSNCNTYSPCPDAAEMDICAARDFDTDYEGAESEGRDLSDEEKQLVKIHGDPDDPVDVAYHLGIPVSAVRKYFKQNPEE